jgi:hypothetical protein
MKTGLVRGSRCADPCSAYVECFSCAPGLTVTSDEI